MRRLWITCAAAALLGIATPAQAQEKDAKKNTPKRSALTDVIRTAWYNINDLVLASAAKMPEEHYGFQPTREVRTFREIVTHIASDHYAMCGATVGRTAPDVKFDRLTTKDEITKLLRESAAVCDMAYGLLSDENAAFRYRAFQSEYSRIALLMSTITHDSEHYGNLVTYMRLKGVVPPSTAGGG
jgi:uncharacterized damage-inducible protein DinB